MKQNASIAPKLSSRRLPVGAEVLSAGGVHFRVWADANQQVAVVLGDPSQPETQFDYPLAPEGDGYFSGLVAEARAGDLYGFRLNGRAEVFSDPASRFQPQGPFGPSQIIDPGQFAWTDAAWQGVVREGQVVYEMHVGTFTPEGTLAAAGEQLGELAELGITVIELMPLADFPGRFGWGYDGVNLFAPTRLYGTPDDLRRFIDRAHATGIGVILDVVYNHFGPSGQRMRDYSHGYFTDRYQTDWGEAINYDGPHAGPVREYFVANAGYWIDEFHFDGLRFDATQNVYDASDEYIVAAMARRARAAAKGRAVFLVAENETQDTQLVRSPQQGGCGLDALWNDDFHHIARVALSGHNEAYYSDYRGTPQEFISAIKYGYLYQGQWYQWHKRRRGTPALELPAAAFVSYIQNHDQVANSAHGLRCHRLTSPGRYRAMTAVLLLTPATPMLFQGQEFAASTPFFFFGDYEPELARLVCEGRTKFLSQFPSIESPEIQACLPDPSDLKSFQRCKLDLRERITHAEAYALHRDLLRLRREDPLLSKSQRGDFDGAVLGPEAFALRFFGQDDNDRLLLVNFGTDLHFHPAPEPLLAPPRHKRWQTLWSSEDGAYGGGGTPPVEVEHNLRIVGQAAIVMVAEDEAGPCTS
jgi:maltooligosyltrehalose trehalohydrolase